ncbi:T3SS effector HopA1 family protein [Actinomycetes bacterium M1A6_2h]
MMLATEFAVAPKIMGLLKQVEVSPGGLAAVTAGETYEDDNPSSVARILGQVLYQTLHNGRDKPNELAMRSLRDPAFETSLAHAMPPMSRTVRAPVVGGTEHDPIALLDGVRVRATTSVTSPHDGEISVELPCARPGLSPGFLYVHGSRSGSLTGPMLRLYAHVDDVDGAPALWGHTTELLESLSVAWHGKILSARVLYPRNDALVIYLQRDGWRHAGRIAESLESTGLLAPGISPFTKAITESVGCAFEPTDKRGANSGLSFGQHRANIFAQALISHATTDTGSHSVEESLYAAFVDADIDPSEPARNLSSPATAVLGFG